MRTHLALATALLLAAPAAASHWDDRRYGHDRSYGYDRSYDDRRSYGYSRSYSYGDAESQNWRRWLLRDVELNRVARRWFDRDGDGYLDRRERWRMVDSFRVRADLNGDGYVSDREYWRARQRLLQRAYAWR